MDAAELKKYLQGEFEQKFTGWDFSHLNGKMEDSPLPWNYALILEDYFKASSHCLDMGTGGGEFLDSFKDLPSAMFATEGYGPNVDIAKTRLQKRGIEVRRIGEDNILPFEDGFFDLIVNRHEEYVASELHRALKPDGYFVTQQVGGMNDIDLNSALGAPVPEFYDWCLFKTLGELRNAGFEILDCAESMGYTRFYDIGSIVYYLKCIPWQIGDFSVELYFDKLWLLGEYMKKYRHKDFVNHRFLVIAQKK